MITPHFIGIATFLLTVLMFFSSQRGVVDQLKSDMEKLQEEIKAQLVCIILSSPLLRLNSIGFSS